MADRIIPVKLSFGGHMPVSTPPVNGANRYAHIDAMRAFAVMLVVLSHAGLGHIVPGGSGVTIFFSISGFIITYLLLREREKTGGFAVGSFYFKRALKILPPFAVVVLLPTLLLSLVGSINWGDVLSQVFFVYNWRVLAPGDPAILPGSGVVWSLSIEEQFYIAFALVWLLAVQTKHWLRITTGLALGVVFYSTAARFLLTFDHATSDRIFYGSDTRLDGIAWGVLAAIGFHYWQSMGSQPNLIARLLASDWAFICAGALYVASLAIRDEGLRDTVRYTMQSLAACVVIVYGLLPGRGPIRHSFYALSTNRVVSLIGLASYSIYLAHLAVMEALQPLLTVPVPIELAILIAAGVGTGIATYYLVEIPAHRWGRKLRASTPAFAANR